MGAGAQVSALPYSWTDILERPLDIAAPDKGRP